MKPYMMLWEKVTETRLKNYSTKTRISTSV